MKRSRRAWAATSPPACCGGLRNAVDVLVVAQRIGAAVFPEDGERAPTLLSNVDMARHEAKRLRWDSRRRFGAALGKAVA